MFGLKDLNIDFLTGNPTLVWLTLALLLALSFWLYRRTNPPVSPFLRIFFIVVRITAVLALCAALFEPVLNYSREFERRKKITVLVDDSSSMERIERDKARRERLDSLLAEENYNLLKNRADLKTFYFGGNLSENDEAVDRDKTALGEALYELKKLDLAEPSDYWLLFSDGKSNAGRRPRESVRGLDVPLVCVDLAHDVGNFDVGLDEVDFNPVVFVGRPTEIKVKLNWHDAAGKNLTVQLLDSARVLTESRFAVSQEGGFGDLTLKYTPDKPGQQLLQVKISPLEGEETAGNNSRTISVKVLKNRLLVLLATDRPDYEVGFLNRFLTQSDKYEVDFIVTGEKAGNLAGRFPSRQTELNRFDLVILHDPDPSAYEPRLEILRSFLSEKGGAVWVLMGPQFARRGPANRFNEFLPFYQGQSRRVENIDFHGEPAENNLFHPVIRLADDRNTIRELWATRPPFKSLVRCDVTDPEGVVLAFASGGRLQREKIPVLGYRRFGPGKLMASAALPFWSWGFVNLGFGEDNSLYEKFLEGTISWLTVQDDFEPVRVTPEKEVFSRGEVVRFNGMAYDQGFRPLTEVTGTVRLSSGGSEVYEKDFIEQTPGRLLAEFDQVPPGQYTFSALLEKGGQVLKNEQGRLVVESFSLEEFDQSGDRAGLMALASLTGGSFYTFEQFNDAVNNIDLNPKVETVQKEIVVWNKFWLLLIFIVMLSVEWILRKLNSLI